MLRVPGERLMEQSVDQIVVSAERERKPYRSPELRKHGSVREVTLTNANGPNFDGGGGANIYAS